MPQTEPQLPSAYSARQDRLLLVHHVARSLGVAPRTVRLWAKTGLLKGDRRPPTPKLWRFEREVVDAFKAQREISGRCFARPRVGSTTNYAAAESRL
jgi:hypothetical protein